MIKNAVEDLQGRMLSWIAILLCEALVGLKKVLFSNNTVDKESKEGTDKIKYWEEMESSRLDKPSARMLDLPGL